MNIYRNTVPLVKDVSEGTFWPLVPLVEAHERQRTDYNRNDPGNGDHDVGGLGRHDLVVLGVLADSYVAIQSDKGDIKLGGEGHDGHDLISEETCVHIRSHSTVEEVEDLEIVK